MKNSRVAILTFVAITLLYYFLYTIKIIDSSLLFSFTAISVIIGYFITHQLALDRKVQEKKLGQMLRFMESLRLFLMETDPLVIEERPELRDRFQDAYFQATLLMSEDSYKKLRKMVEAFISFQEQKINVEKFREAQNEFINQLREEFSIDGELDFLPFDIRIKNK